MRKIGLFWIVMWSLMISMTACQLFAQDPFVIGSSQTIGSFTYATYETQQGPVTASYQRIGNFEYGYFSNGATSTAHQIGRFRYTDYREPARWTPSQYVPAYRRR